MRVGILGGGNLGKAVSNLLTNNLNSLICASVLTAIRNKTINSIINFFTTISNEICVNNFVTTSTKSSSYSMLCHQHGLNKYKLRC